MKVLCICNSGGQRKIVAGVDSAVLRPGEPVFTDEPADMWISSVAPAVRISRLGMSIRESRAREYYHELTLFHVLTPTCPEACEGLPPYILDRAFSPGKWTDIASSPSDKELTLTARRQSIDGKGPQETRIVRFSLDTLGVDSTIALLSRHLTFKTGDLLIFADHAVSLGAPVIDSAVTAELDNEEVLSIRIK